MSKRKKNSKLAQLPQILVSIFILLVFAFPAVVTARWIGEAITGNDPRSLQEVGEFSVRPSDRLSAELKPFKEPLITITFDDGWESVYSAGLPIMQKYGIKSTQYILGDEFNKIIYLSKEQIKDMQTYGHEVGSHSMTHPNLTQLDSNDLWYQVVQSQKSLQAVANTSVQDFASPLGAQNDTTIELIAQHYRSQRNTDADPATVGDEDINTKENFNRYDIIAYTVRDTTTIDDLRALIEYTKARNGWLVLTYHQVDDSESHYAVTQAAFEDQLKFLYDQDTRSAPMGAILEAIKNQGEAKW